MSQCTSLRGDILFVPPPRVPVDTRSAPSIDIAQASPETRAPRKAAPEITNPIYADFDIRYYRKKLDGDKVTRALDSLKKPYTVTSSQMVDLFETNMIACHPDMPAEIIRSIALKLFENGVVLQIIRPYKVAQGKERQIEILSKTSRVGGGPAVRYPSQPLSRDQINSFNSCRQNLRISRRKVECHSQHL